jgi:hypothetical protein
MRPNMPVAYEVNIELTENEKSFRITWTNFSTQAQHSFHQSAINISKEEITRQWLQRKHQLSIGNKLFLFLDGEERFLHRALDESAGQGEPLFLQLRPCKAVADFPFELLALDSNFLLAGRVNLIRRVSDWGEKKVVAPEDRPLKLLFMACSAIDVEPELDFEKEEETIFRVTEKLAVDIEVEDSGSLEGLCDKLETEYYDIVHISGHADIDRNGAPYFIMEDEAGYHRKVTPKMLWDDALIENPPRLLFLSGCRTGETPEGLAALSFAHLLVEKYHLPAVLSWGRSVADDQATMAEEIIYKELSRGRDLLSAVMRSRGELMEHFRTRTLPAWPMLRLYSGGMPFIPIVQQGQHARPKIRNLVHTYLQNSRVKVLRQGFIGRRRQLQRSLRTLKQNHDKVGLLLHGTGGLGKSCLAGKICERFKGHQLIVVHGKLNAITLQDALNQAFTLSQDSDGKAILSAKKELPEKLADLCATSFKAKNYFLLFDDFEQNIEGAAEGAPGDLLPEAIPILMTLLQFLPFIGKMSQLLITSRHPFALTVGGENWAKERLEPIALTSFRDAEQRKKARELPHIYGYPDIDMVLKLVQAGKGNPRLMEWIDRLVAEMQTAEVPHLLQAVQGKQQEFIQKHVIHQLVDRAGEDLAKFLCWFSVFRLPVVKEGASLIGEKAGLEQWEELLGRGIHLILAEHDQARDIYVISPLLHEYLWSCLKKKQDRQSCHEAAFAYYEQVCGAQEALDPVLTEEWIYHALNCGREDVASRQGGQLVTYLRKNLAYLESKRVGK